jgi:hypothetical protein
MSNPAQKPDEPKWREILGVLRFFLLLPLFIAYALAALLFFILFSIGLNIAIWFWWCSRGRDILFVTSDSPLWHDYIEQQILPHLGKRAVVLNWSQRKRWRASLARTAFRHFGGLREFNPLAVVFRPLHPAHTFRFWQPFRDFKNGHPEALHQMESEFFELIGVQRPASPA